MKTFRIPIPNGRLLTAGVLIAGLAAGTVDAAPEYPWNEWNICDWAINGFTGDSLVDERFAFSPPNHKNGRLVTRYRNGQVTDQPAELFRIASPAEVWNLVVRVQPGNPSQDVTCIFFPDDIATFYDCSNGGLQICTRLSAEVAAAATTCGCGFCNNFQGFARPDCYRGCAQLFSQCQGAGTSFFANLSCLRSLASDGTCP